MKSPTSLLLAGICPALLLTSCQKSQNEKPNIVILLADDMGYGDLGCYGSKIVHTPVLDKLASEGVRFTDFYAASAVCSPSRAALMTGRFSVRTGVYSWIHTSNKMHLHKDEISLATLLRSSGYSTAHMGKWHLSYDYQLKDSDCPGNPGSHGFDYWLATGNNASPSHHNPGNFIRNGEQAGIIEGYSSHIVVDEAINWLDHYRDKSSPFFLNLWFHEPHQPVAAPPELEEKYNHTKLPAYYGCIENMDMAIGRILYKLEEMGVAGNTIVIFMSDNGSYMKEGNNGDLRGSKTTLWEGGIRVPGIIRWPGRIRKGTTENTPAGIVDILPTLCEITGTGLPENRKIDGVSLLPLFKGKSLNREKPLYWFYSPSRPVCVIRDGDWCLTADPEMDIPRINLFNEEWIGMIKETGLANFRLYNLREDAGQQIDIAHDNPVVFEKMKKRMVELHEEVASVAFDWREFECP